MAIHDTLRVIEQSPPLRRLPQWRVDVGGEVYPLHAADFEDAVARVAAHRREGGSATRRDSCRVRRLVREAP
jgi:hypothetical protein